MDFQSIKAVFFCLFFLILFQQPVSGQGKDKPASGTALLYKMVQETYGPDQVLINGIYPENIYRNALGHPYLGVNEFGAGYIKVHNRQFTDIYLKYDIYNQQIIITQNPDSENPVEIIPPNKFIDEFTIDDRLFRKYKGEDGKDKFYQVVYDGELKCLETWTKERVESFHTQKYSSFRFKDEIKKSYLLLDEKFYRFKTLGSFLKYFPKELKTELKQFCSREKIKLPLESGEQIAKLFGFCENLLEKHGIAYNHQPDSSN